MSGSNCYLDLLQAVNGTISVGQSQQLADANAAVFEVQTEDGLYNSWKTASGKTLSQLAHAVSAASSKSKAKHQTNYQYAQTVQQQQTQQADAGVQAEQNQTNTDASNNQQKAMLVSACNGLLQAIANAKIS